MGGCSVSCIKYTLFLVNLVFLFGAAAMIVLGVILYTNETASLTNVPIAYSVVVIVLGSIAFILAFLGCCGAVKEISWKLIVYAVLIIIVVLLEVAVIAVAFSFQKKPETFMKDNLKKSVNDREKADSVIWDKVQADYQCCGVEGPKDYPGGKIPTSCCAPGSSTCAEKDAYKTGCYEVVQKQVEKNVVAIAAVAAVVGVCQIIASIAAFWLAQRHPEPEVIALYYIGADFMEAVRAVVRMPVRIRVYA